ncbi:DinB family protein [Candidatus Bathyarchaeota archaeon]|nr:MAG: DinB family protein [Candidatus Bathyarchaeota archaeon]
MFLQKNEQGGAESRRDKQSTAACWVGVAGVCFTADFVGREMAMKGGAFAQQAAPAASTPPDLTIANPVSGFVKAGVARYEKNMVAAAEAMPAEKYGYKPMPEMNSFGHLIMHIAESNNTLWAKISGQTAPDVKYVDTNPKDKLVATLKDSFAFCTSALAKVDDSKLGEQFVLFGNRPISRGGALVALGGSWTDHYATQAIYLRLNGILPPTAQPAKKD